MKRVLNFRLAGAIASTVVVLSYFLGFIKFNMTFLTEGAINDMASLFGMIRKSAKFLGINMGEMLEKIISTMDSEVLTVIIIAFVGAFLIPIILNIISAASGYMSFAKGSKKIAASIIAIVASAYTLLCWLLFLVGFTVMKNDMGAASSVVSFSFGFYLQAIALLVCIVFAVLFLVYVGKSSERIEARNVGLVGVCGMWTDAEFFNNSKQAITIGRDAAQCNIVISENAGKVSRKHCTVRYDYSENMYIVTDFSSNGTFLDNGKKLNAGVPTPVECGTVIILGDENNAFKLN